MNPHAYAVVLAGGRGERFWPASTRHRPKQFISLLGERTMLGLAVDRLEGLIPPERVLVLTNEDLIDATRTAAPELPLENLIGEPMHRDTAAAVALACAIVKARDPDGVFCILTADHVMGDLDVFRATLTEGMQLASSQNVLVTIGIQPTFPATGYGYIHGGDPVETTDTDGTVAFLKAQRFVEKPDRDTAQSYIDSGAYFWNSGMFIWSAESLHQAFAAHRPPLAALIDNLLPHVDTHGFAAALRDGFEPLEKISIDYALMEKADNIVMAKGTFAWDDVGSWPAVENHFDKDDAGNVAVGEVTAISAANNIVYSEGHLTALIGVEDLVVVQAKGVTLICPKDRAQEIKALVKQVGQNPDWEQYL